MSTLADALAFLAKHSGLLEVLFNAIKDGTPEDALKAAILQAKADAYWAALKADLHNKP